MDYWLLNIHYWLLNIHSLFWMLIITVKNSHGFPWLVPVLPFSNKVVFLENFKHGLCLRPVIPATGESDQEDCKLKVWLGYTDSSYPALATHGTFRENTECKPCWGCSSAGPVLGAGERSVVSEGTRTSWKTWMCAVRGLEYCWTLISFAFILRLLTGLTHCYLT